MSDENSTQLPPVEARMACMTEAEYASLVVASGGKVVEVGGVHWRQVRPLFYRPLLPFLELPQRAVIRPFAARFGAAQHPVPAGEAGNSCMEFIISEPAAEYSTAVLKKKDAWSVRAAAKRFQIRQIESEQHFTDAGHPVYVDFYMRTGYSFKSERRELSKFAEWSHTIFASGKSLVLGAYERETLRAVGISQWVGDTLFYAAFFATTDALKAHVSDLMLDRMRAVAAVTPGVRQVYATMKHGNPGLEGFYLNRGFTVVSKPSQLHLNPATGLILRCAFPKKLAQLRGA